MTFEQHINEAIRKGEEIWRGHPVVRPARNVTKMRIEDLKHAIEAIKSEDEMENLFAGYVAYLQKSARLPEKEAIRIARHNIDWCLGGPQSGPPEWRQQSTVGRGRRKVGRGRGK